VRHIGTNQQSKTNDFFQMHINMMRMFFQGDNRGSYISQKSPDGAGLVRQPI
jgi:hypothetical protein